MPFIYDRWDEVYTKELQSMISDLDNRKQKLEQDLINILNLKSYADQLMEFKETNNVADDTVLDSHAFKEITNFIKRVSPIVETHCAQNTGRLATEQEHTRELTNQFIIISIDY